MQRHFLVVAAICVLGAGARASIAPQSGPQGAVSFERDVRPIFEAACSTCHAETRTSGLDLRTRESALKGGNNGPAIVPGRAGESRVYRRIAGLEEPSMPMDGALTAQQIAIIKRWIDEGAHGDVSQSQSQPALQAAEPSAAISGAAREYWAFKQPRQAAIPDIARFANPIDRFLEASRRERGLTPAPRASRETLVRRAYLDLVGLPPDAGRGRRVPRRLRARRMGAPDRPPARFAAVRRAMGTALAGRRALCRFERLRARLRPPERVALPRLRHPLVQPGQAVRPCFCASSSPATSSTR